MFVDMSRWSDLWKAHEELQHSRVVWCAETGDGVLFHVSGNHPYAVALTTYPAWRSTETGSVAARVVANSDVVENLGVCVLGIHVSPVRSDRDCRCHLPKLG